MKKWWIAAMAVMLVAAIAVPIAWAQSETLENSPSKTEEKQLSESQKKQLANLYSKIAELEKQVVDKYLEFGIIDKDSAQLMKQKIDEIQKFRAEKGYLPGFVRKKHHHGPKPGKSTGSGRNCPFRGQNQS